MVLTLLLTDPVASQCTVLTNSFFHQMILKCLSSPCCTFGLANATMRLLHDLLISASVLPTILASTRPVYFIYPSLRPSPLGSHRLLRSEARRPPLDDPKQEPRQTTVSKRAWVRSQLSNFAHHGKFIEQTHPYDFPQTCRRP
jgi:hypothetical protein